VSVTHGTKQWLQFGAILGALYAFVCIIARIESVEMIFPAPPRTYTDLPGLVTIPGAARQEYAAVCLPNPAARYLMVFFHGNGEDLGIDQSRLEQLRAAGYAVLAVDYPGYGRSYGVRSEEAFYECADSTYQYATGHLGWAKDRVIVYGLSLGGAAAVWVASHEQVGGLILESTFMSAYRVMTRWPIVLGDRMQSLARMKQVRCPVLVIHGTADRVIGIEHGRALFAAAAEPKRSFWVQGADHCQVPQIAGPRYWQELKAFTDSLPR